MADISLIFIAVYSNIKVLFLFIYLDSISHEQLMHVSSCSVTVHPCEKSVPSFFVPVILVFL